MFNLNRLFSGLLDDCVPQQGSSSKLGKVYIPLLFHCEMHIFVSSFSPIEGVVEFVVLLGHDSKFPVAYWLQPTIAAVCRDRFEQIGSLAQYSLCVAGHPSYC
ncbi:hypothetical protein AAC387_Pa04g2470 [Persea americana]